MAWVEKRGQTWRVRYERANGTLSSISGYETKSAAQSKARDIDTDTARGQFCAPHSSITLAEWADIWSEAHHASTTTWAKYSAHLSNHVLPTFGNTALESLTRIQIKRWITQLRKQLAHSTVSDNVTLLSMILREAVDENLIPSNPCRNLRIGEDMSIPRVIATPTQIHRISQRCRFDDALLITTAAYTGLRWGELAALQWHNVDLDQHTLTVDSKHGALHEVGGQLTLGPPKTPASVRTVALPPFLAELLRTHATGHQHEHVFTGTDQSLLRRSNFRSRVWQPAVEGHKRHGWAAIQPGLTFHGLRHTHKTWLIEDAVPDILQDHRLGHRTPGVRGIYSHLTSQMTDTMLTALTYRWKRAVSIDDHKHGRAQDPSSQNPPTHTYGPTGQDHR